MLQDNQLSLSSTPKYHWDFRIWKGKFFFFLIIKNNLFQKIIAEIVFVQFKPSVFVCKYPWKKKKQPTLRKIFLQTSKLSNRKPQNMFSRSKSHTQVSLRRKSNSTIYKMQKQLTKHKIKFFLCFNFSESKHTIWKKKRKTPPHHDRRIPQSIWSLTRGHEEDYHPNWVS